MAKVKGDLARARRELADLKEELAAVKDTRDELHAQVERLIAERGGAIATTEKTQETVRNLTAQSSQQAQTVGSLQNETKELRALVENQQTVITEQQALIGKLQKTIEQLQGATGQPGGAEGQTANGRAQQGVRALRRYTEGRRKQTNVEFREMCGRCRTS